MRKPGHMERPWVGDLLSSPSSSLLCPETRHGSKWAFRWFQVPSSQDPDIWAKDPDITEQRSHPCCALYEYLNYAVDEPSETAVFLCHEVWGGLLHSNSKVLCMQKISVRPYNKAISLSCSWRWDRWSSMGQNLVFTYAFPYHCNFSFMWTCIIEFFKYLWKKGHLIGRCMRQKQEGLPAPTSNMILKA